MSFKPTDEQVEAIRTAVAGETFVLDAPAGSGKSSSCRGMCEHISGRVLYLVYNRAAKDDALKTFPRSTTVKTTSQLAWAAFPEYHDRMRPGEASRVPSWETAKLAKIKPVELSSELTLQPGTVAAMAIETIDRFCYTADPEIQTRHVPPLPLGFNPAQEDYLRDVVTGWARKIWTQAQSPASRHRFTMDYAFKLLVMSEPELGFDTVIVDEAQDSNGATEKLVKSQWAQQIIVGDPAQQLYCQPLGTMVEVPKNLEGRTYETVQVPIEDIKTGDLVVTHDKRSNRICKKGRPVSHVTRFHHDDRMVRLNTVSGHASVYTDKHHCVVRIGDSLVNKYAVYMMRQGDNFCIGFTQIMYKSKRFVHDLGKCYLDNKLGLSIQAHRWKADAAWILSVHDSKDEASLEKDRVHCRYDIPDSRKEGSNLEAATECLSEYGRLVEFPLWSKENRPRPGVRRPFATAAANVISGMEVLTISSPAEDSYKSWEEVTVSYERYTGDVVSLEVADHHTYFADGILTHNSWRGATDIMSNFNGPRLQLTQSFRFGQEVADEAAKWLAHTETGITIKGLASLDSSVGDEVLERPSAVLCRTNAGVISEAMKYLTDGLRVAVVGGTKALTDLAFAAADLMAGRPCKHPELIAFTTWKELMSFSKEPGGGDLKALVNLINMYGVGEIIDACKRLVPERSGNADVIVSTGHKSKGRQFNSVQVGRDFESCEPEPFENPLTGGLEPGAISRHDAMLHYVVVTRAQSELARGGLSWIDNYTTDSLEK